jgi:hypothetical protein
MPNHKSKNLWRTVVPTEPEEIDDEENWLFKEIVNSRTVGKKKKVK